MTVALSIDVLVAAARSSIMSDAPREGEAEAVAPATATRADSERSTSPEGSSASFATCTTTLTDTDSVAPSDDGVGGGGGSRDEAKRRRAADKRAKETHKRDAAKLKAQAKKDEAARKQEEDRAARKASVEAERQRRGDAIFVPFVDAHTPEDSQRSEAKAARQAQQQQGWDLQEADWSKAEMREYYKAGRSKPKGKTPVRETRQFADL